MIPFPTSVVWCARSCAGLLASATLAAALILGPAALGAPGEIETWLDGESAQLLEIYRHLHAHPELSFQEAATARIVAERLRAEGIEVTERFGDYGVEGRPCHGIVGVLRNGEGPTVLVRTDLDALPIVEATGLPFASRIRVADGSGGEVGVMHACGHDVHMTVFLGTARYLARHRDAWRGTVLFVGQPAEERGAGARAMLAGGLYEKFGRPDCALALHCSESLEAGSVGICPGHVLANVDTVDIRIRGRGGHGAYPHLTVDPIVAACQVVVALQTLVSRNVPPLDPAVVTVGSIHGGTKHNIIPDEVRLQLTVRCLRPEVRRILLEGIERITRGTAAAAGIAPDGVEVLVSEDEHTGVTTNDPALTARLEEAFRRAIGEAHVFRAEPVMAAEDFGRYALDGGVVPSCIFWLGVVPPDRMARHRSDGEPLPSLHSSVFAPDAEPAIRTGVTTMASAVLEVLGR